MYSFRVGKHQVEEWNSTQSALNMLTLSRMVRRCALEDSLDVCFIGRWLHH
jgi:hypothetical protein